ncbi:glycosyltransferase [Parasphingopyxis algicola]|uniref:glycosyltransferase n=1 Tax=Parasphingopyxis algicola TaxID=2026624 RepID=UPI0015A4411E|nr:glycosyltransferase [Parasphingopyxis algicola]QLC24405.1 glycosyltransferase [Parasphingopyxis algicola]
MKAVASQTDCARPKPKIAQFLYEPGDGGLDRVAIFLTNGFAERGYPSELWMARPDGPSAALISDKVIVRTVPGVSIGPRGFRLFAQIPALSRMIRSYRPDVLLSAGNQSNLTVAFARRLAFGARTKIVQKITNPIERPHMSAVRRFLRRLRFGLTIRLGDRCLTLSKADAITYARAFPTVADRFKAVRNAYVTPAMLAVGERRMPRRSQSSRFLAVGRLAPQKDYETMLYALAQIADRPWTLTILGEGPMMSNLRALAAELGLAERIIFTGFVADPTPYLASADLFLLSSRWEGFPAAPLEAMAAGCDVVATDCSPGLTEILKGIGRFSVPVGNPAAFAAAIVAAVQALPSDFPASAVARRYSIETSVTDHLRLIEGLLI